MVIQIMCVSRRDQIKCFVLASNIKSSGHIKAYSEFVRQWLKAVGKKPTISHIKLQQGLREGNGALNGLGLKKKPDHKRKPFRSSRSVFLTKSLCKKKGTEKCVFHNFLLWCFAEAVTSQDVLLSSLPQYTETPCKPLWALIQCLATRKMCFCLQDQQNENQYVKALPPTPVRQPSQFNEI